MGKDRHIWILIHLPHQAVFLTWWILVGPAGKAMGKLTTLNCQEEPRFVCGCALSFWPNNNNLKSDSPEGNCSVQASWAKSFLSWDLIAIWMPNPECWSKFLCRKIVCVCMHVCVWLCVYICNVCVCMRACDCVCVCDCACVCMCVCDCVCVCVCVCV